MVKKLLAFVLVAALAIPLYAKSYSSGSHSYSSGSSRSSSSSSGRSSSSSGSSHSSGVSSGSHSYSSGSSSYSSGSRSGYSSPPSPSSGSHSYSATPRPSGDSSASSGGKSFSSGNRTYSSGGSASGSGSAGSFGGKPAVSSGGGGTVSGGSSYKPGQSSGSGSRKPDGSAGYDSAAARAHAMEESRATFTKSQQPRTSYVDSKGEARRIDPQDRTVQVLRDQLDHEKWVNRDLRTRNFYGSYWSRPVVVYHDSYNSWFWWWLLDRSISDRAYWAYCHRSDMDQQRYRDLLAKDAGLEARIRQLEAEQRPVDPTYVPPGIDRDLTYTDAYVNAVYNPQPVAQPVSQGDVFYSQPVAQHHASRWPLVVILIGGMTLGVWFVFIKRW